MSTEIKTSLTLDDKAGATLKRLKGEFDSVREAETHAQSEMHGFFTQAAATAAGVSFVPMIRQIGELGVGMLHAAEQADDFDLGLAGMIAGIQDVPWDQAVASGHQFGDEIDALTLKTGVLGSVLEDSFKSAALRMGGTNEAFEFARKNVEDITKLAHSMRIPIASVSEEIGMMAEGFIKPKSALMSLLRTTGDFGKTTKGLREGWMQLTDEKRLAVLQNAIGTVADRLEDVQPTLPELTTSLKEAGRLALEAFGLPVMHALIPELEKLRDEYIKHRAEFEKFADSLGQDLGTKIHEAAEFFQRGFEYVRTHADEIHQAIVDAFRYAKSVIDVIIAHKDIIAMALGAKAIAGSSIGKFAGGAASVVGGVAKSGFAGTSVAGAGLAGIGGSIAALGAFGLALGGAALAVDQFAKLLNETKGGNEAEMNYNAVAAAVDAMIKQPQYEALSKEQIDHVEHLREELLKFADAAGHTSGEVRGLFDQLDASRRAARGEASGPEQQAAQMQAAYQKTEELKAYMVNGISELPEEMMAAQEQLFGAQEMFSTTFQNAIANHNDGLAKYMATVMAKSTELQQAFLSSSSLTAEGFDALAALVGDQADEFRQKLEAKANTMRDIVSKQPKPFGGNLFTGGQVFKINQDLRGEDPDRIAFVFNRDIAKAAENRVQASTASIFGT